MSQDRFWEQWSGGSKPGESGQENPAADPSGDLNYDVLAAWLKEPPANDTLAPVPDPNMPHQRASDADLSTQWPAAVVADPFGSLHPNGPGGAGAEWDLVLESPATAPTPPVPVDAPPPIPPPVPQRVEAGIGAPPPLAVDPLVTMAQPPAAPVAAAQGLGFDLSGLAAGGASPPPPAYPLLGDSGPLPFQTLAGAAGPAPSETTAGRMPAGEAGSTLIPALKLEVSIGRRVIEQVLQGEALIGRPDSTRGIHPEIDLRLDDAVSRRHAKIFPRNGGYILKDLNSTNGTRFNRRYLQAEEEVALRSGDEIEVGEMTVIRVVEAPSAT